MSVLARNAAAVDAELRRMAESVRDQQKRIDGLVAAFGTLSGRIEAIETMIQQQRIATIGRGSTHGV